MDEIEGLDFMSPNERERYIKEQLEQTRKQRIIEARKAYSQFTKNHQHQYSQQKKERDAKRAKAKSRENNEMLKSQIAVLQARLEAARNGLGSGQANARELELQEQQERVQDALKQAEQEKSRAVRFKEAMAVVRENDPRIPMQKRAETIKNARQTAISKTSTKIKQFAQIQKKREEEERIQVKAQKKEEFDRLHPKLYLDDYARTFYHADVGLIPVNHEADQYLKDIDEATVKRDQMHVYQKQALKQRTAAAAHKHQVVKDTQQLQKELAAIQQIEVNSELESLKENPQKEHSTAAAYQMDERERKRQARIQRFLALSDEAPKPRGPAPQPQPMHVMTTSPAPSSDDEDVSEYDE